MDKTKALNYAISIIRSYESDIKNLPDYLKENGLDGFCGGCIYKDAIKDIKKLAGLK